MPESQTTADSPLIVITTLAEYQTGFWASVAEYLREQGLSAAFISFDDRSTEMLRARGFEVHSGVPDSEPVEALRLEDALRRFGVDNLSYWFSHERVTFAIRDSAELRRKLFGSMSRVHAVLEKMVSQGRRPVVVQEVGGFLSVIATYFAARALHIDNWFIEPSFFRGRLFFTRNSFAAPDPRSAETLQPEVAAYLQETIRKRQIVVPIKDRHQYSAALGKVASLRNLRRLVQKVVDKYVLGKRQEFGYIGRHVGVHISMLRNSLKLRKHYSSIESLGKFVYFPFHVPADMALTLRAPEYLDQLALIDYMLRVLPHTHVLAVKEHPAMIGAIDARRLIALKQRYDNLAIISPATNNYEVLGKASLVVSINSKSGAEAMLVGTPVAVLGDAFYRRSGQVRVVERLDDLGPALRQVLQDEGATADRAAVERFFQGVWDDSHAGELFVDTRDNAVKFGQGMIAAIGARG